jgi:hypothetical protein
MFTGISVVARLQRRQQGVLQTPVSMSLKSIGALPSALNARVWPYGHVQRIDQRLRVGATNAAARALDGDRRRRARISGSASGPNP